MEIVVPEEFRYLYVRNDERPVVKIPDPVLRRRASEVAKVSNKTTLLIDSMHRIMRRANGVGLAAPQVGIGQRVLVVSPVEGRPFALVNPRVVLSEGSSSGQEGCLSIPGLYGDVVRADAVRIEALDRKGRETSYDFEGMTARIVLHEIDHLDGILFIDKVDAATLHWSHPDSEPGPAE